MIKIFPHVLMRVSGGPFEQLQLLNMQQSMKSVVSILQEKNNKKKLKEELSEKLFAFIQQITESRQQNLILNIRRDIFNGRKVSPEKMKEAETILSDEINEQLKNYFSSQEIIISFEKEGASIFTDE